MHRGPLSVEAHVNSPLAAVVSPQKHHINDENFANKNPKNNLDMSINSVSLTSPSTPPPVHSNSSQTITFRQFLSSTKTNSPYSSSAANMSAISSSNIHYYSHQPHTPTMFPITPCGSVYNPQFSKEHIMNIIKHKALQKLKKIESEVNFS